MKIIILSIFNLLYPILASADCSIGMPCHGPITPEINALSEFEQLMDSNFRTCNERYSLNACQEQSRLIRETCIERNGESKALAIQNCRIGKMVRVSETLIVPSITTQDFDDAIHSPEVLAKVLGSSISPTSQKNKFVSNKHISVSGLSVDIKNNITIKKTGTHKYKIVSDHYDNVFVFSEIDISLDPKSKKINIKAETFLKNSAVKKLKYVPFSNYVIEKNITASLERLKTELEKI